MRNLYIVFKLQDQSFYLACFTSFLMTSHLYAQNILSQQEDGMRHWADVCSQTQALGTEVTEAPWCSSPQSLWLLALFFLTWSLLQPKSLPSSFQIPFFLLGTPGFDTVSSLWKAPNSQFSHVYVQNHSMWSAC